MGAAAALLAALAGWWYGFPGGALRQEMLALVALAALFFVVATIVISAALLSFSIHELQRIPTLHQKPRTVPIAAAAVLLMTALVAFAYASPAADAGPPAQVVTSPTSVRAMVRTPDARVQRHGQAVLGRHPRHLEQHVAAQRACAAGSAAAAESRTANALDCESIEPRSSSLPWA